MSKSDQPAALGLGEGLGPDGKLHEDGYFTWHRRDGYVLDAKLPAEFVLADKLRAALDQKHAEYEDLKACAANNARNLAREAHTWSKAAETYAAELERHKPLMQAVEWLLDDGHMNQEHLARLRAAWEGA